MQQWWKPVWGEPGFWTPDDRVSRVVARLGDLEWQGRYGQGSPFVLRSLSGWWSGGAWSGGPVAWDGADGGVQGDVHVGGRSVSMRFLVFTSNGAEQMDALDLLAGAWATNRWQALQVEESERGLVRQLVVSPRDLGDPELISDTVAAVSWTLTSADYPLVAPDLRKVTVPSGGVDVRNDGTYPAATTARLVGPLTNPGLSWDGGSWSYQGTVSAGQTITAEMWRRRVVDEATATHSRMRAQGSWLAVAPGTRKIKRTGSGSGRVELEWRSSWA